MTRKLVATTVTYTGTLHILLQVKIEPEQAGADKIFSYGSTETMCDSQRCQMGFSYPL
jgi:hypothetical protein